MNRSVSARRSRLVSGEASLSGCREGATTLPAGRLVRRSKGTVLDFTPGYMNSLFSGACAHFIPHILRPWRLCSRLDLRKRSPGGAAFM